MLQKMIAQGDPPGRLSTRLVSKLFFPPDWSCGGGSYVGLRIWCLAVCLKKLIKNMWLANVELATNNTTVIHAQHSINVFHTLRANISELLNLGRRVFDLLVCER